MSKMDNTHVLQVKGDDGNHKDMWKFGDPDEAQIALKEHQTRFPHHEARLVSRMTSTEDKVLPSINAPKSSAKKAPKAAAKPAAKTDTKSAAKKATPKAAPKAAKPEAKPAAKKAAPKKAK